MTSLTSLKEQAYAEFDKEFEYPEHKDAMSPRLLNEVLDTIVETAYTAGVKDAEGTNHGGGGGYQMGYADGEKAGKESERERIDDIKASIEIVREEAHSCVLLMNEVSDQHNINNCVIAPMDRIIAALTPQE